MITTFQALVVALLAVLPGATYTFAYERHAGAYGAHLSDRLVRFLVVSGIFHAALAGPEFALQKKLLADSADPASWWQIETIAVVYVALPFVAGSTLGWATQKDKRWARAVVGSSRYPRAWDHLWSQGGRMIVRVKLRSGEHLAGLFEPRPMESTPMPLGMARRLTCTSLVNYELTPSPVSSMLMLRARRCLTNRRPACS